MDLMGDTLTRPVAVTPVRLTFRSVNMSSFAIAVRSNRTYSTIMLHDPFALTEAIQAYVTTRLTL